MSYPREIRLENATEALIVEQALAMARDLKQVADAAPDGQVLARAEQAAVRQGRELTRKSLQAVLNAQGEDLEKKRRRAALAAAAAAGVIADDAADRC
jgi:uncharacterized protein YdeI (YjbR/CyaY-like superfamily)